MSKDTKKAADFMHCISALTILILCCAAVIGAGILRAHIVEGTSSAPSAAGVVDAAGQNATAALVSATSTDAPASTGAALATGAGSDTDAASATGAATPTASAAGAAFATSSTAILTGTEAQIAQMTSVNSYEVLGIFGGTTIARASVSPGQSAAAVQLEAASLGVAADPDAEVFTLTSKTNDTYSYNANGYAGGGSNYQYYEVSEGFTEAWDYARAGQSVAAGSGATAAASTSGATSAVEVAVIDTGAQLTHEDLQENVEWNLSYDIKTGKQLKAGTSASSSTYYNGDYGSHGTSVCSLISATTNNGVGLAGTSYGAKVIPIAALEQGGNGSDSDVVTALSYIDGLIESGKHPNLKIVNMSFGTYTETNSMYTAMHHLYSEHGVLFVCAGGNGTNGSPNTAKIYPADYDFTLSVTSVDANGKRSTWADYNSSKDIAAAGEGMVVATTPLTANDSATAAYGVGAGTSFSAPVVTGAAALLYSLKADLTPEQAKALLKSTATQIAGDYASCGCAGELNAAAAVQALIDQYYGGVAPAQFADEYGELPHTFGKNLTITWSADNTACHARGTCDKWIDYYDAAGVAHHNSGGLGCGLTIDEDAVVTYAVKVQPTATKAGVGVYTAKFSGLYAGSVTKSVEIPAGEGAAGGAGAGSGAGAGAATAAGSGAAAGSDGAAAVSATDEEQIRAELERAGVQVVKSHTYADFAKTENADGSVTYTYTDATAHEAVVRTVTAAGAVCTSVTGATGAVTTSVDLGGVDAAAAAAGPVELPLTADLGAGDGSFAVRIDGAAAGSQVRVSLAVSGASPQTVVVKKAVSTGTLRAGQQILRNSFDGNNITFSVDGAAEYTICVNAVSFDDVAAGAWYKDVVDFVAAHEIMNGMGGKGAAEFAPDEQLSRGMMACVLYNLETGGLEAAASAASGAGAGAFADVSSADWFAKQAAWAASAGVITGYADGTFGGNDLITREQVATMLWRYAGSPAVATAAKGGEGAAALGGFADAASVSGYAQTAVEWCVANGIIQGNDGNILPGQTATRAEIAAMVERYCAIL